MSSVPPLPPSAPGPGPGWDPPPGSPTSWGAEPPRPRLARRGTDRVIGGVCGGLADHLGIDATIVRVAAVLLALTGWGILIYLVAWAALPVADPDTPRPARRPGARGRIPWLPVIIVIALLFMVPSGFSVLWGEGHFGNATVPILLLGVVAWLMWRATHGESPLPGHRGGPRVDPGAGWSQPPPPAGPTAPTDPSAAASSAAPATTTTPAGASRPLWAGGDEDHDEDSASPAAPTEPAGDAGEPDEDPLLAEARRMADPFLTEPLLFETAPAVNAPASAAATVPPSGHQRRGGGRAFLAALLIGAGAVGLAWALGVSLSPFTVLAGLLIAFGVALIFGGFAGRSNRGLIIPGLIVFGLMSVAATLDVDLPSGGVGERNDPACDSGGAREQLLAHRRRDGHRPDGRQRLSRRRLGRHRRRGGLGELTITVPEDVTVIVDATADLGSIVLFDEPSEGFNRRSQSRRDRAEGGGVLDLDLSVFAGEINVDRPGAGAKRPERPERPEAPHGPPRPPRHRRFREPQDRSRRHPGRRHLGESRRRGPRAGRRCPGLQPQVDMAGRADRDRDLPARLPPERTRLRVSRPVPPAPPGRCRTQ